MKKHGLFIGIAAAAAFAVILAGCSSAPSGGGEANPAKKLTITGLSGITTSHIVVVLYTDSEDSAAGNAAIRDDTVTIQLKKLTPKGNYTSANWTGSGSYYIDVWETKDGSFSGKPNYSCTTAVSFSDETTTVPWSAFSPYSP
jgi:hypothetical protein